MIYEDKNGKEIKIGDWGTFFGSGTRTRYVGQVIKLVGNDVVQIMALTGKNVEENDNKPLIMYELSSYVTIIDDAAAMLYLLENGAK